MDTLYMPDHHPAPLRNSDPLIVFKHLNLWYGRTQALFDLDLSVWDSELIAFIGPSGCGKSTALQCFNRMHDLNREVKITGSIHMEGQDIFDPAIDPPLHRRRFGWVAQRPNPFRKTIWENVAYGPRIHGLVRDRHEMETHVESCLRRAELWDEVKDDLHTRMGDDLSGGQQQRLCIARALSTKPQVLLMDEPTGSIDPVATGQIEELMLDLKRDHAVVVVTHSMMQARRVADRVACFHLGRLVEIGPVEQVFANPRTPEAREFLAGKLG